MRENAIVVGIVVLMVCVLVMPVSAAPSNGSSIEKNVTSAVTPVQVSTTLTTEGVQAIRQGVNTSSLQNPEGNAIQATGKSNSGIKNSIIDKKNLTESQKKLSTALLVKTSAFRGLQAPENTLFAGKPVYVYVYVKPGYSTHIIDPYVTEVPNRDENYHLAVAWMNTQNLETLASLAGVRLIEEVTPPVVRKVTTEGDEIHLTEKVRQIYGDRYTGSGMKIGIISNGVDSITESQARGELPQDVTVLSNKQGGDEGTAMLEIVHDMAPDAKLYFHDYGGNTLAFNDAIDALVASGCTVICDDLGWYDEPYFQDGIVAEHIKNLISSTPVIYVSAAGNDAEIHYIGYFSSYSGTPYHDFSRGTNVSHPKLYVDIPPGSSVSIFLQWDDVVAPAWFGPFPVTTEGQDYDLYLSTKGRSNPTQIIGDLGLSENPQSGYYPKPYERLDYKNHGSTTIHAEIDIKQFNAAPRTLNLYILKNDPYSTVEPANINPTYSIFGHPAVPDVIAVAAVPPSNPYTIEKFSSQGPVRIIYPSPEIRQKPDISGVDKVSVTGAGGFGSPFSGTSASAPHVAAIVAQYWGSHPSLTPLEVRSKLYSSASDLGTPGPDTTYGSGLADALTMQRPTSSFSGNPTGGSAPLTVTFTNKSRGSPTGWTWYFGDETYTGPWIRESQHALKPDRFPAWYARYKHSSVALPNGGIVLMGGMTPTGSSTFDPWNDVWRSTDNGKSWTQMTGIYGAGWSARGGQSALAMADGSIILMGGRDITNLKKDVWRSRDNGATWYQVTGSAGWSARSNQSVVVMPSAVVTPDGNDGSIVLMGGEDVTGLKNDVWRSTDYGSSWTQVNANAPWSARREFSSVATLDGKIIIMGGYDGTNYRNDVWRSTDNGAAWTLVTANAPWPARSGHTSVAMPDGSIVLMGGGDSIGLKNDVWRSTDNGATWTQVVANAPWSARSGQSAVVMQDGIIVLMGGWADGIKCIDDTWSLMTRGSAEQDPSHTYTKGGMYTVALQANTSYGAHSMRKVSYINLVGELDAYFTGTPSTGNAPLGVQFTDRSTGYAITNRVWDFGDGNISSYTVETHPFHLFANAGTYRVKLTVTNAAGTYSDSETSYITVTAALPPPIASFTGTPVSGTAPLEVMFTDSSLGTITNRRWDFGDGNISNYGMATNPSHRYTSAGTYTVNLTVTNTGGSNSLPRLDYISVSAPPSAPVAAFTGTPLSGPRPLDVMFTDNSLGISITNRSWDFGDGNISSYGVATNPSHRYTSAGTYTVKLTVTNASGSNSFLRSNYITVSQIISPATFRIGVTNGQMWYLDTNGNGVWDIGSDMVYNFGATGWTPVIGDWNGYNTTQVGVYKEGMWYLDQDGSGTWNAGDGANLFGALGWTSVQGDWNGDKRGKIGIYKDGAWYLDYNGNGIWETGTDKAYIFGALGWTSVLGDWNGDNKSEIGIYKDGTWYLDYNGNGIWETGIDKVYIFGAPGWTPVVGDWNPGVPGTKIGIYRDGVWYLDIDGSGTWNAGDRVTTFGAPGWIPVVGDWNPGVPGTKIGIYRDGVWYLDIDGSGTWNAGDRATTFGASGWSPVIGKWN